MADEKTPLALQSALPPAQPILGAEPVVPKKPEEDKSCCCQITCSCLLGSVGVISGATATKCLGATSAAACGWGSLAAAILGLAGCFFGATIRDKQNNSLREEYLSKRTEYETQHAQWLDRQGEVRAEANRGKFQKR